MGWSFVATSIAQRVRAVPTIVVMTAGLPCNGLPEVVLEQEDD
jgi:hypothetical protein